MIRIFIAAMLLLNAPYKVLSQKDSGVILQPKTLLRFNVLGLTDITDENLSFGIEHRFNSKWSTGTDLGWVIGSLYLTNLQGVSGVIVRPFLRYYPKSTNIFWETELHYKYVSYKTEDWLGRMPDNNVPAYEEYTKFKLRKNAIGMHFKWGVQANISSNKKFKFEFVTGTGIRYKWHKVRDGFYTPRGIINTTQTYLGPVFLLNLRLVYALK
jgi:hypothetical protein